MRLSLSLFIYKRGTFLRNKVICFWTMIPCVLFINSSMFLLFIHLFWSPGSSSETSLWWHMLDFSHICWVYPRSHLALSSWEMKSGSSSPWLGFQGCRGSSATSVIWIGGGAWDGIALSLTLSSDWEDSILALDIQGSLLNFWGAACGCYPCSGHIKTWLAQWMVDLFLTSTRQQPLRRHCLTEVYRTWRNL